MRLTFDVLGDSEATLLEASFFKVKVFKALLDLNRDKVLCSNGFSSSFWNLARIL